ncbi:acetyl/propionyl/methylcrotonyl-CoA carboxylase subunit alpha [Paraburkholderia bryophila]|uniref:Propionyl-CoA carboxylase alpha chain/3-methylcrotonyl-CoA carboxylase alpha subunit n=1 Tax=Paraburkholderia bryophila TaxID=420952 RepID=A0A329BFF9_9BURK|nr:biotin carboxylase N-terminal domain-containing protein [Paraburkholderia bryophila]RAS20597.1 propionyl-CoA carboxylase alpha chain/3-methylcrotonyl-CoA carboxylase alpha subunit [Paraburkholderia bryophila]
MFKRILIANRGEIARRIARTCRRLEVEYVSVYSAADRNAAHLEGAVEREPIGEAPASSSYLNAEAIIAAALRTGCEAIHPGYGFLSENAAFAAAVEQAGLVFIGPDARTIDSMGNKATAKKMLARADVPVVPGSREATESHGLIRETCEEIGYPVILKPVAGGGGKGMQVVTESRELDAAIDAAIRIGKANFGDGRLLVERYIATPRHLEVQIFGDSHGNVVHLFERECSLQRRHQKIVEEAPASNLPADVRARLLAAAVRGAQAIGYVNAGTFEFILAPDDQFYFLEVNTRLQVEHPVTEAITGLDLVEWQLRIAAGEVLPLQQDAIRFAGHAIECRVYAEDPDQGFCPMPGEALRVQWPDSCRVDAAFDRQEPVPSFYDPMVAKLIAHGANRPESLRRLQAAIAETTLLGLTSNLGFAQRLLQDPRVQAGQVDTHLVDDFIGRAAPLSAIEPAAACAAFVDSAEAIAAAGHETRSPWAGSLGPLDRIALDPDAPLGRLTYQCQGQPLQAGLLRHDRDGVEVEVAQQRFAVSGTQSGGLWKGRVGELAWAAARFGDVLEVSVAGTRVQLLTRQDLAGELDKANGGEVVTRMPGAVVALPVEIGARVEQDDVIAIVEAMKMENRIYAPAAGTLSALHCRLGDIVAAGQTLASIATGTA